MGIIADDRGNANILDSCFWNWVSYTLRAPIHWEWGIFISLLRFYEEFPQISHCPDSRRLCRSLDCWSLPFWAMRFIRYTEELERCLSASSDENNKTPSKGFYYLGDFSPNRRLVSCEIRGIIADDTGNANILDSCIWNWVSYTLRAPIPLGVGGLFDKLLTVWNSFENFGSRCGVSALRYGLRGSEEWSVNDDNSEQIKDPLQWVFYFGRFISLLTVWGLRRGQYKYSRWWEKCKYFEISDSAMTVSLPGLPSVAPIHPPRLRHPSRGEWYKLPLLVPRFPLNEGDTKTSPKFFLSLFVLVPTRWGQASAVQGATQRLRVGG